MKIKQIISTVLLSTVVCGALVACGTGCDSGGTTPPAAPEISNSEKPAGFADATGNSGAAWNIDAGQIAIPSHVSGATGGYEVIQMDDVALAALEGVNLDQINVNISDNGSVVLELPGEKSIALVPSLNSNKSIKSAVSSNSVLFNTSRIPADSRVQSLLVRLEGSESTFLVYAAGPQVVIAEPTSNIDSQSELDSHTSTLCAGPVRYIAATKSQGVDYLAIGTEGPAESNVCVMSGANMKETNLSAQAVAHTQGRPQEYNGTIVRSFGFPANLNTGNSLVGYWFSGGSIYKVLGSYVNGTPTGNGFLKTTLANVEQTTQQGATKVTFTGTPTLIASSYTDNVGNLWAGTTDGKVYVLRNGATQWTNLSLGLGATPVTVSSNGTDAGATVTMGTGANISVSNVQ